MRVCAHVWRCGVRLCRGVGPTCPTAAPHAPRPALMPWTPHSWTGSPAALPAQALVPGKLPSSVLPGRKGHTEGAGGGGLILNGRYTEPLVLVTPKGAHQGASWSESVDPELLLQDKSTPGSWQPRPHLHQPTARDLFHLQLHRGRLVHTALSRSAEAHLAPHGAIYTARAPTNL